MKGSFLIAATLCALLITDAVALKCYVCADTSGNACTGTELDCGSAATNCIKATISGSAAGNGFVRSCGSEAYNMLNFDSDGYFKLEAGGAKAEYWKCDKDLCNNSVFLSFTSLFMVLAAFFAYY